MRQRESDAPRPGEAPSGMIEIHAQRGDHRLRVFAQPDGNARRLTRQLAVALLANCGEIHLPDDPDEGAFASPHALDGIHAFVLEAKTRAQMDLDAMVVCPTCSLGVALSASLAQRTWAELGYRAGDGFTLHITGKRLADMTESSATNA